MDPATSKPWKEIANLADSGSPEELERALSELPECDVALTVTRLTEEQQTRVLTSMPPEEAAGVVDRLPDTEAADLLENLEPETAAAILDALPSSEQADLIGELRKSDAEAILEQMDPAAAEGARALSCYPADVAGGLMITEFVRYEDHLSVGDAVEDLRARADEYRDYDVQYAYVCDSAERLTGVLRLRDLLLAKRTLPVAELMIQSPISVRDDATLDELADLLNRHRFLGVPVTDAAGRLVGVVRKGAVAEAWGDRQSDDFLKSQGIVGEEIRTMSLARRSSRRLAWLSVNIVLNIAAASVIALYQDTLSAVIALAVFLPIISDMSGCSGNQAVAVSMRELSLGLVRPTELFRVLLKEVSVGLINGLLLGLAIAFVAFLWKGNAFLGLVVGVALGVNTVVAVAIGGCIPLLLKRLKIDPAIASGPILTTVTDMCGFLLVLGIASQILPRLAP
ncbi:MAG: magnesium transporter [Planctomycetota bacterium]